MAKKDKIISIEETLWDSANKLRGTVEPSEYKHVVLSPIFLKCTSDKFEERRNELKADYIMANPLFNQKQWRANNEITDDAHWTGYDIPPISSSDSIQKLASTFVDAQVDLNPHQVEADFFAFRSPLSKGAILADEVGLGKTIEAGLVIAQKLAERKRKTHSSI